MSKKTLRFGIIGCSSIAKRRFIPAINSSKLATLEIVGSRSLLKARKWAKEFSIEKFGTYDDVMKSNVDSVYISLPPYFHEKLIIKAAKNGKNIIVEKPACLSVRSAKKIINVCALNNVNIKENFSFILHPQHIQTRKYISSGIIGETSNFIGFFYIPLPHSNNFRWKNNLGSGALNDLLCYPIYASRFIFKSEPIEILCTLTFDKQKKVDIKANAIINFKKNKIAYASSSYGNYYQSRYSIYGTKGVIHSKRAFSVPPNLITNLVIEKNDQEIIKKISPTDHFRLMIDNFCRELNSSKIKEKNYVNLIQQAKLLDSARESHRRGRLVIIPQGHNF